MIAADKDDRPSKVPRDHSILLQSSHTLPSDCPHRSGNARLMQCRRRHEPPIHGGGGEAGQTFPHATVRAAVAEALALVPGLPIIAGGKSFGARMTSQAWAAKPLAGVRADVRDGTTSGRNLLAVSLIAPTPG
jgi:hypothetical protein